MEKLKREEGREGGGEEAGGRRGRSSEEGKIEASEERSVGGRRARRRSRQLHSGEEEGRGGGGPPMLVGPFVASFFSGRRRTLPAGAGGRPLAFPRAETRAACAVQAMLGSGGARHTRPLFLPSPLIAG